MGAAAGAPLLEFLFSGLGFSSPATLPLLPSSVSALFPLATGGMMCAERVVFGGATVHAAETYAAGEEGVMAQRRPPPVSSKATGYVAGEIMQESLKAEEGQLAPTFSEAKCAAGEEGVMTQGCPLPVSSNVTAYIAGEFVQESIKADKRQLPLISSEALAPYKCSFIKKKGYILIQWCQLPVIFLFAIVLSASFVCSEAADQKIEEGHCQYNLIGIAALSCQHHKDPSVTPSRSCCKSLLHAVDEIPPVGESGECCLCLYSKYRLNSPALATSYISCYGKDMANVAKWTDPIKSCNKACNKTNILPGMGTPVKKNPQNGHGSRNTKILSLAVLLLLILLVSGVCFCWVRQKRDSHQTVRRVSLPQQPKKGVRRRSLGV